MSRPERDRINRILGAYAIGAGKRYYGRTIDGLIGSQNIQRQALDRFLTRHLRIFEDYWQSQPGCFTFDDLLRHF